MPLSTERDIEIINNNNKKELAGHYFVKRCFTKTKEGSLRKAERITSEKSKTFRMRTVNENSMMIIWQNVG